MNKQVVPFLKEHFPAVLIFILLPLFYFLPTLEGKKIVQSDIIQAKSMQGEILRYEEKGDHILWVNNMFSGMPSFQIRPNTTGSYVSEIIYLFRNVFGDPNYFLIIGMTGIYIFCLTLGINRWLAILAAIGFAFSSFNIISIEAGHSSKVRSMALMAPLFAGILLTFRGKLLAGFLLTAFFAILQVRSNHAQINYYSIIVAGVLSIFELYRHLVSKDVLQYFKAFGLLILAGAFALACNTSLLWSTYDYSKQTIRGTGSELKEKAAETKAGGLDKDYAFAWSQGIVESFTFIVPGFSGGGSGEPLDTESETYKTLTGKGVSANQAENIIQRVPTYWGNQPFTSGPIYFGAALMFLALFGFLASKNNLKWGLLAAILLALFLAWGKNFSTLSFFFFDYVPMYNKFRTPAMMLCVIMMILPIIAALGLNELFNQKFDKNLMMKNLKISGGIMLGLCIALWAGSSMFNYTPDATKNQTDKQYYDNFKNATNDDAFAESMVKALKADRESMMKSDAMRSLFFIALAVGFLYLVITSKLKVEYAIGGLALLVLVDLWAIDKRYLNETNFTDESEYEQYFRPRQVDLQILQDTDIHYRVHDVTADPFNSASASRNLKTVGGYHAAKLQRYQDVIERHLRTGNMDVLNMLNTKYFIVKGQEGQPTVQQNPGALGNAWAVKAIQYVKNADEEISALEKFKPDSLAFVDVRYKNDLSALPSNLTGNAKVSLTSYHPDKMVYSFESNTPQLVVFSEVFYNGNTDWKSYIDGKEAKHVRANYTLRAMLIPAGKHEIVFEFIPASYYTGEKITLAANVLFLLIAAGYFFQQFRKK